MPFKYRVICEVEGLFKGGLSPSGCSRAELFRPLSTIKPNGYSIFVRSVPFMLNSYLVQSFARVILVVTNANVIFVNGAVEGNDSDGLPIAENVSLFSPPNSPLAKKTILLAPVI